MDLTRTAYGTWSGGRYMHFGESLSEDRFVQVIQHAYQRGVRTFVTADVYGNGAADETLGRALAGFPLSPFSVAAPPAHFFYWAKRGVSKFSPPPPPPHPPPPNQFAEYVRM